MRNLTWHVYASLMEGEGLCILLLLFSLPGCPAQTYVGCYQEQVLTPLFKVTAINVPVSDTWLIIHNWVYLNCSITAFVELQYYDFCWTAVLPVLLNCSITTFVELQYYHLCWTAVLPPLLNCSITTFVELQYYHFCWTRMTKKSPQAKGYES